MLCTMLVAAPRALDTLPAPAEDARHTTLDLYLVPRVLGALAALSAHAAAASSLHTAAQQYPEWLAEATSKAVAATMQLLGTALHLGLESAHQPGHVRYLLFDAVRCASQALAHAHELALGDLAPALSPALLQSSSELGSCTAPEAYAPGPAVAPCAVPMGAEPYVWSDDDAAPLVLPLSTLPAGAPSCLLFLCVRVAAELAAVFPSALHDLVELGARVLIAQWESELRPGTGAHGVSHIAAPYLALLRYDAWIAALPVLPSSVCFLHALRLSTTSFSLLFHPVDDPYFHTEPGAGPYAATYTQSCERLSDTLRTLYRLLDSEHTEAVSIVSDLRLLRGRLVTHILSGDASDEPPELRNAFRRCCLALLCIVLTVERLPPDEAQALHAFAPPWASSEECEALHHALQRGTKRGSGEALEDAPRRAAPSKDWADKAQTGCPLGAHCASCAELQPGEACTGEALTTALRPTSDAGTLGMLARLAVHAPTSTIAALDMDALARIITPNLSHTDRAVRLAAGRLLSIVVEQYAQLPRDARPDPWAEVLVRLVRIPAPLLTSGDARIQESCILTMARLGRVRRDETFTEVAAALVRSLYLPHVYLRALAYTETMQLAARRRCTTFQLLSQHLDVISPIAVDAMHSAPHGLVELARLLNMSQQTFLHTTLEHTLPHLVHQMVSGRRDEASQALRAIASAVGQSVPALCLNQTSDIFEHFFLQPDEVRDAALEALLSLLGTRAVTIASLLRSRLHEVLGYLVARLGDPQMKPQALAGLEYVRQVVTAPPSRWKDTDLQGFLRDEVLAILTWINEELSAVHGKIAMARKAITARSVGELVQLIGAVAARVAPQILACLNSTLAEPELALATLESWRDFVQVLRYQDVGPFVGQTAAALLAVWPRLGRAEKKVADAILRYTIVMHGTELESYIDHVPSLDAIEDDIPDIARQLRSARRVWIDEDHFRHILARVAHDNAAVCVQSLRELHTFLRERRTVVEAWTSGNVFHELIGECVRVLLAVAGRAELPDAAVQAMCLECLGILGAVDPDRLEMPLEEPFFVLLSNFENSDETVAFATRLLTDLIVPAFRATSDTKHQAALAYAIQELLKVCGFTPTLLDAGARSVPEKVRRRWEAIPEAMLPTLMPLLNSKYVVQLTEQRRRPSPVYRHSSSFRDWIQVWVLQLMLNVSDPTVASFFAIFRSVVRDHDVTIARYLLPHLALHTLISGTAEARGAVLDEIHCVLTDQVAPAAGYSAERRRLTTQTVFHLMDHIGHWMRRVRLVHAKSSKRSRLKEALGDVQSVMDNISQELTAQASLQCHAYPRSLLNFEYRIRSLRATAPQSDTQLQELYETMHEIYAQLDDPDGMEGISTKVFAPSLEHQIREHESTGRWTDAQSCWEVELQQRPNDAHLHLGLLRCLRSLGHYDTLRTHIRGVLSVHPDWQPQFASFQIEGACILADWDAVKSLAANSHSVPELAMARALLAMRENDKSQFGLAVHDARMQLGHPLVGAGRVPYTHAYDAMTQLHMLHELEMVFHAGDERAVLDKSLGARFRATLPSFRTREPVLSVRRSAFLACAAQSPPKPEIGQAWILTAKTARRAGHAQTAYSAVLQALQSGAPYAFVQKAKLLAHNDQVQAALQELAHALQTRDAAVGAGGTEASAADRRALARAHLLHARLVEDTARFQHNEIIQHYKTCTALDPDSEKVWYYLGHFYDSPSGGTVGNQMLLQLNVCRFYMKSAQNGTKFLYRTLPRMLTIWLDAGNELAESDAPPEEARQTQIQFDKINEMMRKSVRHLARYQWFAVFPQLVARIVHKNEAVWQVVLEIIVAVLLSYPQQSMWALIAGSHSKDRKRKQRYGQIVERIKSVPERAYRDVALIVEAFEQLSAELLHLCEFHVGKESTLSLNKHFPALVSAVQSTPIVLPLQSSVTVTLPPNNAVDQAHRPFPSDAPTIESTSCD